MDVYSLRKFLHHFIYFKLLLAYYGCSIKYAVFNIFFHIIYYLIKTLFLSQKYYYYAICIIVISLTSIILSLYETKRVSWCIFSFLKAWIQSKVFLKQAKTLHEMTKTRIRVNVCRGNNGKLTYVNLKLINCFLIPNFFIKCLKKSIVNI